MPSRLLSTLALLLAFSLACTGAGDDPTDPLVNTDPPPPPPPPPLPEPPPPPDTPDVPTPEDPVEDPVEDPTADPTEEPVEEPVEEPEDATVEQQSIQITHRVPVVKRQQLNDEARGKLAARARSMGYDRVENVRLKNRRCNQKTCVITATGIAVRDVDGAEASP